MESSRIKIYISLFIFFSYTLLYAETRDIETEEVVVIFEGRQIAAAEEVAEVFPSVKEELTKALGFKVDFRPTILLDKGGEVIKKTAGNDTFVAYAVPERSLIVLDTSRVYAKPFSLKSTLKHELCHLLLHCNIEEIPQWFDEGICQWASEGIAELMTEGKENALQKATVSGKLIRIKDLHRFPLDNLTLAYEESKSIIEYIQKEFGSQGIIRVLGSLEGGYSLDESFQRGISITPSRLEERWNVYLKRKYTWFSYMSRNIYLILFLIGALATLIGFMRFLKRKKEYVDEDE